MTLRKKNYYYFKGLCKTTCYKTNSVFFLFFFSHWLFCECFLISLSTRLQSLKNWLDSIDKLLLYKNGDNLKILIEIFRQKRIVFKVILIFLEHLKAKIFFVRQPWWRTYSAPSFRKNLDPSLIWLFVSGNISSQLVTKENSSIETFFRKDKSKKKEMVTQLLR